MEAAAHFDSKCLPQDCDDLRMLLPWGAWNEPDIGESAEDDQAGGEIKDKRDALSPRAACKWAAGADEACHDEISGRALRAESSSEECALTSIRAA